MKPSRPPSLRDKLRRAVWNFARIAVFRCSPIYAHRWRVVVLKIFGAKIGRAAAVYPSVQIWAPWNLELADNVTIGPFADLYNVAAIKIGSGSIISQKAVICTASHDYNSPAFELLLGAVAIENNCWIAAEAFVCPGIRMKQGSVALARSVVTKHTNKFEIVAGNPARKIKIRSLGGINKLTHFS